MSSAPSVPPAPPAPVAPEKKEPEKKEAPKEAPHKVAVAPSSPLEEVLRGDKSCAAYDGRAIDKNYCRVVVQWDGFTAPMCTLTQCMNPVGRGTYVCLAHQLVEKELGVRLPWYNPKFATNTTYNRTTVNMMDYIRRLGMRHRRTLKYTEEAFQDMYSDMVPRAHLAKVQRLLQDSVDELNIAKAAVDELALELGTLKSEQKQNPQMQQNEVNSSIVALQAQLSESQRAYSAKEAEHADLLQRATRMEAELQTLREIRVAHDALEARCSAMSEELVREQKQYQELRERYAQSQAKAGDVDQQARIEQLEAELLQTNVTLTAKIEMATKAEADAAEAKTELAVGMQQLEDSQSQLATIRQRFDTYRAEMEAVRKDSVSKDEYDEIQRQLNAAQNDVLQRTAEFERKSVEAKNANEVLQASLRSLQDEYNKCTSTARTAASSQKQLDEAREETAAKVRELEVMQRAMAEKEEDLKEAERQMQELRDASAATMDELNKLRLQMSQEVTAQPDSGGAVGAQGMTTPPAPAAPSLWDKAISFLPGNSSLPPGDPTPVRPVVDPELEALRQDSAASTAAAFPTPEAPVTTPPAAVSVQESTPFDDRGGLISPDGLRQGLMVVFKHKDAFATGSIRSVVGGKIHVSMNANGDWYELNPSQIFAIPVPGMRMKVRNRKKEKYVAGVVTRLSGTPAVGKPLSVFARVGKQESGPHKIGSTAKYVS